MTTSAFANSDLRSVTTRCGGILRAEAVVGGVGVAGGCGRGGGRELAIDGVDGIADAVSRVYCAVANREVHCVRLAKRMRSV
jgi:hypothetical protein